ncbi:hypothetical protein Tco_0908442 [Tanacetum coccineum]|uniref:Uncharacterized protein n=1 Tax=Tanacetum coccineum TaxID=301880 RepID=A0ABQ5CP35_9ASTR
MPQNQGDGLGNTDDQANVEAASRNDWFKKPKRPPTHDSEWNTRITVDSRPPQTWISRIALAEKPPYFFDDLSSTPIDFSAYVMHNLKIDNLTQEILVGPAYNLLKGTCKSFVELEYHFKECFKVVNDQIDWNNPEGHEYPFNLSKPQPLVEVRYRQVVPVDYFINNDLEYLKVTKVKVMKCYDYGHLEKIEVRREDQKLYKFMEGDFSRLNLQDIKDMWVEDLQQGVESYQKKLNITRPETFRSDITKMTPYTPYKNPHGIIYLDKLKRNRLMRSDELYKFCDGMLTFVRTGLHDIISNLNMDYLPQRRWNNLDKKRSRIISKGG